MPNVEFQAFLYLFLPKIKNLSWKKIEGNRRKQKEKKSCLEENRRKQKEIEGNRRKQKKKKSCLEENGIKQKKIEEEKKLFRRKQNDL